MGEEAGGRAPLPTPLPRWLGRGLLSIVFLAALAWASPKRAHALPFLHLFLQGDLQTLGSGGADPFRDLSAEALRLDRPALLAGGDEGLLILSLDNELTLALRAGPWAGTRADDQRLGLTAVIPLGDQLGGVPISLLAGVRRETGLTHLRSTKEGTLFRLEEEREWVVVGFTTRLPHGLSFAGALEQGGGDPRWLAEVRYQPIQQASLWLRHREDVAGYRFRIPDGAARKLDSPALTYSVQLDRRDLELGGSWTHERVWAQAGLVAGGSFDYWAEAGGKLLPWLGLRIGSDRTIDRFDDRVLAQGTGSIAAVDLGVRRERYFGGADLDLGLRDQLVLRYVFSRLQSLSRAEEIGTNAAQALLHVDYDFGLLFRSGYRIMGHQIGFGWRHATRGDLSWSLGAQYFHLSLPPGAYELTSEALGRALAAEALEEAAVSLVGLTASVDFPLGGFQFGAAVGQYVPLAMHQAGGGPSSSGGSGAGSGGAGAKASSASWVDRLAQGLRDYGGGNRLLLQITRRF